MFYKWFYVTYTYCYLTHKGLIIRMSWIQIKKNTFFFYSQFQSLSYQPEQNNENNSNLHQSNDLNNKDIIEINTLGKNNEVSEEAEASNKQQEEEMNQVTNKKKESSRHRHSHSDRRSDDCNRISMKCMEKYKFKYNFKKFILKSFEYAQKSNMGGESSNESCSLNSPPCTSPGEKSTAYKLPLHSSREIQKVNDFYTEAIKLVRAQGLPKSSEDINTTINLTELAVRRIINFLKLVIDINDIHHEVMILLLKNSMMSLLQIHGVNSYDKVNLYFINSKVVSNPVTF